MDSKIEGHLDRIGSYGERDAATHDATDAFRYATLYNTEQIKNRMRRGILWEGWLAAARRNARNG